MDEQSTASLGEAAFELQQIAEEDTTAFVKMRFIDSNGLNDGADSPRSGSNIQSVTSNRDLTWNGTNSLAPEYNPDTMLSFVEVSNVLRQCLDAYAIGAHGPETFEPVIDLESSEGLKKLRHWLYKRDGKFPSKKTLNAEKDRLELEISLEYDWLITFFKYLANVGSTPASSSSFSALRQLTCQDEEGTGNAYWEVLRDLTGVPCQFNLFPVATVRILHSDGVKCWIKEQVRVSPYEIREREVPRTFRRYIQQIHQSKTYFKEYRDPRLMCARCGKIYTDNIALLKDCSAHVEYDQKTFMISSGLATEVFQWQIPSLGRRSEYGSPRWTGNLLAVLGNRQAEQINFSYFESKSVPPLAILVSGGRLSSSTVARLEQFIENQIKGSKNFHKIMILEAESGLEGRVENTERFANNGRLKIDIKPLTEAMLKEGLFMDYIEKNTDHVGQSFRLPRIMRGDIKEIAPATLKAATSFAETWVFQPLRERTDFVMNNRFLPDFGAKYHKFVTQAPVNRDPTEMANNLRNLSNANILRPKEGRKLASDVFNYKLPDIDDDWVNQPVVLTLAQMQSDAAAAKAGSDHPSSKNKNKHQDDVESQPGTHNGMKALHGKLGVAKWEGEGQMLEGEQVIKLTAEQFEALIPKDEFTPDETE